MRKRKKHPRHALRFADVYLRHPSDPKSDQIRTLRKNDVTDQIRKALASARRNGKKVCATGFARRDRDHHDDYCVQAPAAVLVLALL